MLLRDDIDHFDSIVSTLNQHGILQDFILIGSWVLRVYQEYFKHDTEVPILATKNLDFLVTNPPGTSDKLSESYPSAFGNACLISMLTRKYR